MNCLYAHHYGHYMCFCFSVPKFTLLIRFWPNNNSRMYVLENTGKDINNHINKFAVLYSYSAVFLTAEFLFLFQTRGLCQCPPLRAWGLHHGLSRFHKPELRKLIIYIPLAGVIRTLECPASNTSVMFRASNFQKNLHILIK